MTRLDPEDMDKTEDAWLDTALRGHYAIRIAPSARFKDSLHMEMRRVARQQEALEAWMVILGNSLVTALFIAAAWILLGNSLLVLAFTVFSSLAVFSSMLVALITQSGIFKGGRQHAVIRN